MGRPARKEKRKKEKASKEREKKKGKVITHGNGVCPSFKEMRDQNVFNDMEKSKNSPPSGIFRQFFFCSLDPKKV